MKVWERGRDYQVSMYAEIHATLRNICLDVGFKPPVGKAWTGAMFLSGYESEAEEYDWKAEKQKMTIVARRVYPEQQRVQNEALADTTDRFRQASEAAARGASREEIRLLMEA